MFIIPLAPTINKWNKIDKSIFPKTSCTAITVFNGKLDSTLGLPRLTKFIKDLTYFPWLRAPHPLKSKLKLISRRLKLRRTGARSKYK